VDNEAYSGRWVACLRGRIVAQGGTPDQARRAALSRFKEKPEIVFVPMSDLPTFPPMLEQVLAALPADQTVYLVGGAVRDLLLGRPVHDLDFALARGGVNVARKVANALGAAFYPLDPERDTGRVLLSRREGSPLVIDFAAFRGETLEDDLIGRDFTLNAIAIEPRTLQVFDPLGGMRDLKDKLLRACSPTTFHDDPVRILRGVRLAADFGFRILPETRQAMKEAVPRLADVSGERVRDELFRILTGPDPATCLRALDLLGVLTVLLPELASLKGVSQPAPHVYDVWEHTLAVLAALKNIILVLAPEYNPDKAADLLNGLLALCLGRYRQQIGDFLDAPLPSGRTPRGLLFLAALYHDVAKPQTRTTDEEGQLRFWGHDQQGAEILAGRARRLNMSNAEIAWLETVVRMHMRILFHTNRLLNDGKMPTRRAIYRFFREAGPAGVGLCLLALADLRATYAQTLSQETWSAALDVVRLFLENWYEKPAESVNPPPLLNGDDLMQALGLPPGPKIGQLLESIREAQAMGELSTRDEALALARKKLLETP
jgi:putative nucleotidyltransferase with HDIG domain